VERLLAAGAILIGKTNTPELTLFYDTDNLVSGKTLICLFYLREFLLWDSRTNQSSPVRQGVTRFPIGPPFFASSEGITGQD
jgi:hypothetical protein